MAMPVTHYAKSGDVHIAYQVFGSGPIDLVLIPSGDMAGSPRTACPLARPYGGNSVSQDARRARSGAPGKRSDQQSAKESARALSTLSHAAGSAAPFGAALDHLPPAFGSRRSLPRSVPGIDRRADFKND